MLGDSDRARPDRSSDTGQPERERVDALADRFATEYEYIQDPSLRLRVLDWLHRYEQAPIADPLDYIESELARLRAGHRNTTTKDTTPTRVQDRLTTPATDDPPTDNPDTIPENTPSEDTTDVESDVDDAVGEYAMHRTAAAGEDTSEFPDSCAGCEHYGVSCPVFHDTLELDERARLRRELADAPPTRVKTAYRQFAQRIGCQQIERFIREHETAHQDLATAGWELMALTDVDVGEIDPEQDLLQLLQDATTDAETTEEPP
jgi:hypothetical protein